jgi:hypothetical protein
VFAEKLGGECQLTPYRVLHQPGKPRIPRPQGGRGCRVQGVEGSSSSSHRIPAYAPLVWVVIGATIIWHGSAVLIGGIEDAVQQKWQRRQSRVQCVSWHKI